MKNIYDQFLEMEEKENLFNLQLSSGTYYWDIIRVEIFTNLLISSAEKSTYPNDFVNESLSDSGKTKRHVFDIPKLFFNIIKDIGKLIINKTSQLYIIKGKPEYIFTTYQKGEQNPKDHICDDLIDLIPEKSICIELLNKSAINYINLILGKETRVPPVFVRRKHLNNDEILNVATNISSILKRYFNVSIDVYESLSNSIEAFNENKKYYLQLFENLQPKAIIGTYGGSLKGMYSAAIEKRIPMIELQHGTYGSKSIWKTYPKNISSSHPGLAIPTLELTFSDYWDGISNYPVRYITSIGSNEFYQKKIMGGEDILFVSNLMYNELLTDLVLELSNLLKDKKIYYKIHPQQFKKKNKIIDKFKCRNNVLVIAEEIDNSQLIKKCSYVVGIRSTLLYIALQAGKNVFIYKKLNYNRAKELLEHTNVFDNAKELRTMIKNISKNPSINNNEIPTFFAKFDKKKFLSIIYNAKNYI